MLFVHSDSDGGNVGFRNKILCSYIYIMVYSVYIIHFSWATCLQYWPNNIMYIRVSADEISHGVNVCIDILKMFHSGVILYYYCRIDEDRNIMYSRTHIQIVNQHDTIYYTLYILYTTLTTIYEQIHCRFTFTNFQSSLITQPIFTQQW